MSRTHQHAPQQQAQPAPSFAPQNQRLPRSNSEQIEKLKASKAADEIPEKYAGKSDVWKMGYRDGVAQAKSGIANIDGDALTLSALQDASKKTGVDEDNLTAMAIIESTGNRNIGTNSGGFTGLMQMGRDSAKDLGLKYSTLQGGKNVKNNALAGAKYWNLNDKRLDESVPRDPLHMYLAHQQGAGGTNKLMETLKDDPTASATGAQKGNLPEDVVKSRKGGLTQQDFYDYWAGKMTAIQDALAERRQQQN